MAHDDANRPAPNATASTPDIHAVDHRSGSVVDRRLGLDRR